MTQQHILRTGPRWSIISKTSNTYSYPHTFYVDNTIHEFIQKFSDKTEKGAWLEDQVFLGARVTNIRHQGKKWPFMITCKKVNDFKLCAIQTSRNLKEISNNFTQLSEDEILSGLLVSQVEPKQLSDQVLHWKSGYFLLSFICCLKPTQDSRIEKQIQKRYSGLIMNNKTRDTSIMRSKVVNFVRQYLNNLNFVVV